MLPRINASMEDSGTISDPAAPPETSSRLFPMRMTHKHICRVLPGWKSNNEVPLCIQVALEVMQYDNSVICCRRPETVPTQSPCRGETFGYNNSRVVIQQSSSGCIGDERPPTTNVFFFCNRSSTTCLFALTWSWYGEEVGTIVL